MKIADGLDSIVRRVGLGCGWLIIPLILIIVFDVVTRKLDYTRLLFSEFTQVYGYSVSTILQDFEWHLHGVILLMSFGVGYLANAHVRVDVFREMASRRKQGWMEFWGLLLMGVPSLLILIWYSFDLWAISFNQNEGSESMTGVGLRWIVKFFLPLGFIFLLMAVVVTMIRLIAYLRGDEQAQYKGLDRLEIFADDHAALEAARLAAETALKAEAEKNKGP
ncbi:TRAP transporter small permease subunit [Pikeienuella piscinae]|uniref:TRAP transporter small permease protein n=1 Tax=Pikeienuella piscinae TaxID=2748098 RepID=A0A7L5BVR1_9RHOB|nr:TRAP transporter small permease subunit [Pikeienuella piscinae]QIE55852.1 TRAP transporter small permease subunit [Pikeienuella piscinae]